MDPVRRRVLALSSSSLWPPQVRWLLLRACGLQVTWNIRESCHFGGRHVAIGRGTYVNRGCVFDGHVSIGKRCAIGMGAAFISSTHELGDHTRRAGPLKFEPIRVGDGCWIGSRAMILPGVTIGDGVVVAAGAVVREDCAPNTLYAGVPARAIRELS
jgi:maltose O-acetyltransferase